MSEAANRRTKKMIRGQLERMAFYNVWEHLELTDEGGYTVKRGDGHVIESLDVTSAGVKVKFPDRLKAVELLLRLIDEEDEAVIEMTFKE